MSNNLKSNKRALLKVLMPAKPGAKQEELSFILAVGQRESEIEVLEIDDKAGIVKVDDFGTITNLNFVDNGVKLAGGAPPGPPGAGGPPNFGGRAPAAAPVAPAFPPGVGGYQRTIPRQMTAEQAAIMEAAYTLKNQKAISQGLMPPIPGSNPILDAGNTSPKSY